MVQQVVSLALLSVAGKLAAAAGKIAGAGAAHVRRKISKGSANAFQDVLVRRPDFSQRGSPLVAQDQSKAQAASSQQHGAAAAGTAENRNAVAMTGDFVNIFGE